MQQGEEYPLVVYLHGGASADICKGDVLQRQLEFMVRSSPFATLVDCRQGPEGLMGSCIHLAPCCPPNVAALGRYQTKADGKRKVYWFKTCEGSSYYSWQFSGAQRCHEVELLVAELLDSICGELPVDKGRIYLVGQSAGGYGVLRLAELLPQLAAAVVPMSGYYPSIPGHDHEHDSLLDRLRDGPTILPMHCQQDRVCSPQMPAVHDLYEGMRQHLGIEVQWRSSVGPDFHTLDHEISSDPDRFLRRLLDFERPEQRARRDSLMTPLLHSWQRKLATPLAHVGPLNPLPPPPLPPPTTSRQVDPWQA
jgi:pimeloyl-ACP methyl ester carboxylesterase